MVTYPRCGFGLQTVQMERCRNLFPHSFWPACLFGCFLSILKHVFCPLVLLFCFLKNLLNTTEAFIKNIAGYHQQNETRAALNTSGWPGCFGWWTREKPKVISQSSLASASSKRLGYLGPSGPGLVAIHNPIVTWKRLKEVYFEWWFGILQ